MKEKITKSNLLHNPFAIFTAIILGLIIISPALTYGAQVTLTWDANTEADIDGYRLFIRHEEESYDYTNPNWEGNNTSCQIDLSGNIKSYLVSCQT